MPSRVKPRSRATPFSPLGPKRSSMTFMVACLSASLRRTDSFVKTAATWPGMSRRLASALIVKPKTTSISRSIRVTTRRPKKRSITASPY